MVIIFPLAFISTGCVQIINESNLFFNPNIFAQKYVKGMNNYRILFHKLSMCVCGLVFCFLIWCLDLGLFWKSSGSIWEGEFFNLQPQTSQALLPLDQLFLNYSK